MNRTKKITQGAMMLAIIGALMLIDRQLSYMFGDIIVLLLPVVIILYSSMHTVKDGLVLVAALAVIVFLFGTVTPHYIYFPITALLGVGYSYGVAKGVDRRILLFLSMGLFVVGEAIVYFVIFPLIGIDIATQLAEMKVVFDSMTANYNEGTQAILNNININVIMMAALVVSTVFMGIMEGLIIHMLCIFLLKRFKVKDLGSTSLYDMKVNPAVAYFSMAAFSSMFFIANIQNETILAVFTVLSITGAIILLYLGYIFAILYGKLVWKKNVGFIVVLFTFLFLPMSIMILAIIGFMYGAGPLRISLERKVEG